MAMRARVSAYVCRYLFPPFRRCAVSGSQRRLSAARPHGRPGSAACPAAQLRRAIPAADTLCSSPAVRNMPLA